MKKCISVAFIVVFLISLQTVIEACRSVSGCKVVYDPRCSTGERSFGCNAGGQGKIKIQITVKTRYNEMVCNLDLDFHMRNSL